ncbi:hypothetical protein [Mixta calida]|uniref:hypothetical protein n=1 Tax=Mixta calida TaxID=665913 RepID=UPI002913F377|nr:hypothetical protein [Mixta calida]MDU6416544.1 hypothetical protein [Mixta calida]
MSIVVDMELARLIEQGKGDPGEITDLLLAAGYSKTMTIDEWIKATANACRIWRELCLPFGGEPETAEQVLGCVLNDVIDEALNQPDSTRAGIASAVLTAGFFKGAAHD